MSSGLFLNKSPIAYIPYSFYVSLIFTRSFIKAAMISYYSSSYFRELTEEGCWPGPLAPDPTVPFLRYCSRSSIAVVELKSLFDILKFKYLKILIKLKFEIVRDKWEEIAASNVGHHPTRKSLSWVYSYSLWFWLWHST